MALASFLVASAAIVALLLFFDRFGRPDGNKPRWVPVVGCIVMILFVVVAGWAFVHSFPLLPD